MRVALLTNILSPYRVPVYRVLTQTPGWSLRVLLSAETEFDRSWCVDASGLDAEVVRCVSFRRRNRTRGRAAAEHEVTAHLPFGVFGSLRRFRPDVVVSAELGARTLFARLYCALFRVPLVVWSYHSRASATSAGPLRRWLWRALLGGADAVIGMGTQAREVLRGLGVPEARIFDAPNAHAHEVLRAAQASLDRAGARRALRERTGARDKIAVVVGRLVPVKGVATMLQLWRDLPEASRRDWTLLFVGDGPLDAEVCAARDAAPPGAIAHTPAVQPQELASIYAASDLLLLPSLGDTWGLVVNEAFACGLPALCSKLAGCADDLVEPGLNGFLFDPTSADATERLAEALASPDLERLGGGARATAERFRPAQMADGMRRAVAAATGAPPRPRRSVATAGLTLAAIAFCATLAESGLRLALDEVDYLQPTLVPHATLPHAIAPGSGGHDAWGFRNREVPERAAIVAVGDSQTYGVSAPARDAWPAQLAKLTGEVVYNLGIGGSGPPDYRWLLDEYGPRLRPDVAVVGFYFGNDLPRAFDVARAGDLPAVSALGDDPRPLGELRSWLAGHSVLYQVSKYALPLLTNTVRFTESSRDGGVVFEHPISRTVFTPERRHAALDQERPENRRGLTETLVALERIELDCAASGRTCVVLLIPTKESVYWELAQNGLDSAGRKRLGALVREEDAVRGRMLRYLDGRGRRVVDPLPALRRAVGEERLYPAGADGHPNAAGYRVIAETVADALPDARGDAG